MITMESSSVESVNRAAYRSFLTAFVSSSIMLLAAISAMNVVVDPHGAWQTKLLPGGYDGSASRIGKGELLHWYRGSTVLIGNSRTLIGIRPDAPGLSSPPALNLGLSGSTARELWAAIERAIEHPTVREILLFVDFQTFKDNATVNADFAMSRLNGERSDFDHHCDLLFNGRTLGHSCKQLSRILTGRPPEFTAEGFSIPERLSARAGAQHERATKLLQHLLGPDSGFRRTHYSPATVETLRPLIRRCQDRSIQLTVAVNPNHATLLEGTWQTNQWNERKRWLRELTQLIEEESQGHVSLWDFSGFHAYTTEPYFSTSEPKEVTWFWEPSHFKCELGDRMLERIYGLTCANPTFGVRLTSANAETHLEQVASDRRRWQASQSEDAQWISDLVNSPRHNPVPKLANQAASPAERR